MANFTAADVKKLREATGAGMMDAKKALDEADGDFDAAVEVLRVHGAAKAAKRGAEREASNGLVAHHGNTLIKLAAETDFVAKNAEFQNLAKRVVQAIDAAGAADVETANAVDLDGHTVAEVISGLAATIGEKLELAEVARFDGDVHVYLHRRDTDLPPQVGVMVAYSGDAPEVLHQVALQIAAMRPDYLSREDVPTDVVNNERRIAEAAAREEGKPEQAISKIVDGRTNAFFKDVVLLDQISVAHDKQSVGQIVQDAGLTIERFVRLEAGA